MENENLGVSDSEHKEELSLNPDELSDSFVEEELSELFGEEELPHSELNESCFLHENIEECNDTEVGEELPQSFKTCFTNESFENKGNRNSLKLDSEECDAEKTIQVNGELSESFKTCSLHGSFEDDNYKERTILDSVEIDDTLISVSSSGYKEFEHEDDTVLVERDDEFSFQDVEDGVVMNVPSKGALILSGEEMDGSISSSDDPLLLALAKKPTVGRNLLGAAARRQDSFRGSVNTISSIRQKVGLW